MYKDINLKAYLQESVAEGEDCIGILKLREKRNLNPFTDEKLEFLRSLCRGSKLSLDFYDNKETESWTTELYEYGLTPEYFAREFDMDDDEIEEDTDKIADNVLADIKETFLDKGHKVAINAFSIELNAEKQKKYKLPSKIGISMIIDKDFSISYSLNCPGTEIILVVDKEREKDLVEFVNKFRDDIGF